MMLATKGQGVKQNRAMLGYVSCSYSKGFPICQNLSVLLWVQQLCF